MNKALRVRRQMTIAALILISIFALMALLARIT